MERYNDDELMYLMRCGSQRAFDYLYENYYRVIQNWIFYYMSNGFEESERDDCLQEAMLHFYKILDNYRLDQAASLRTYMFLSIRQRMKSYSYSLKKQREMKSRIVVSIDETVSDEGDGLVYEEIIEDPYKRYYPRLNCVVKEQAQTYQNSIQGLLSPLENNVMALKTIGYTEKEIAEKLDISLKCVYNAAYRYYKKVRPLTIENKYAKL